jgi:DNA-damage-inducible protein J
MTSVIQVPVDAEMKSDAEHLFSDLGLDVATAIRIFLKQALSANGMPFPVKRPNTTMGTFSNFEPIVLDSEDWNVFYSELSEEARPNQNLVDLINDYRN